MTASRHLDYQEIEWINKKAKEIIAASNKSYGFGGDTHIYTEVTDSYLRQREVLKNGGEVDSDIMQGFEKFDQPSLAEARRQSAEARLEKKINHALSGPTVGFGDLKRITRDVTEEFEKEERFRKMKF